MQLSRTNVAMTAGLVALVISVFAIIASVMPLMEAGPLRELFRWFKLNGAVALTADSIAVLIVAGGSRRLIWLARLCALFALAIGVATIIEYLANVDLRIDTLVPDRDALNPYPGRLGFNSATAIVLCSAAAFFATRPQNLLAAELLAIMSFFMAVLAQIGGVLYVLRTGGSFSGTIPTLLVFTIVSVVVGVLATVPRDLSLLTRASHRPHLWRATAILGAGLLVTFAVTDAAYRLIDLSDEVDFTREAERVKSILAGQVEKNALELQSLVAFLEASDEITREKWQRYVGSIDFSKTLTGAASVNFLALMEAQARDRRVPNNRTWPEYDSVWHAPILYSSAVPIGAYEAHISRDAMSDAVRRRAMMLAVWTRGPAMTDGVHLYPDSHSTARRGFIIYVPVFEDGHVPAEQQARWQRVRGFVSAAYFAQSFIDAALKAQQPEVETALFASAVPTRESLLHATGSRETWVAPNPLERLERIDVFGRTWTLLFRASPKLLAGPGNWTPQVLLAGGIAISVLMFGVLLVLLGARDHAESRALEMTSQLRAANRRLSEFAHVVSHDLRAPLRHIDGFVGLMLKELGPQAGVQVREWGGHVTGAVARMTRLIDDLLRYARLGREGVTVHRVSLQELLDSIRARTVRPDGPLEWKVAELPVVYGHPTLLSQVFENLVDNAIKFAPKGVLARIEVTAEVLQEEWLIAVTDNGPGISRENRERVFEPFQRLPQDRDTVGTGIGLAVCRRVVELHGGRIWVDEDYRDGTRFLFTLPRSPILPVSMTS